MQTETSFNLKSSLDIEIAKLQERIDTLQSMKEQDPAIFQDVLEVAREIWSEGDVWTFLCRPHMLLDHKAPVEVISSGHGEDVKTLLLRMIHGVYV